MKNFFELHDEKIIGYKKLTNADLGLCGSHQTHIGLLDGIFTFLTDSAIEESSILIYENDCQILDVYFDRITRKNGTIECPKIRKGGHNIISMVTVIRDIVRQNIENYKNWYLIWFGLKSKQLVFMLLHENSTGYNDLKKYGLKFSKKSYRITAETYEYNKLSTYIENFLNTSSKKIIKELEIETQIPGKLITENKIRKYDVQKAKSIFTEIGQRGEEFIAEYFDKLQFKKQIKKYTWANSSSESGFPYDFWYQDMLDNVIYLDVKTTKFNFEQKIIYSDKEINFALSRPRNYYNIYRVYDLTDNNANLRICKDCMSHFNLINKNILTFQKSIENINTNIQSISVAFEPTINNLSFEREIQLKK